ncbi:hypothetical protein AWENTII_012324 [Aspergillus wentii]
MVSRKIDAFIISDKSRHADLTSHTRSLTYSPSPTRAISNMPSFTNDVPYQSSTATTTHPRSFDSPQGKPHDKAPVGNTFLWTNWPNGDSNHLDAPPPDHQVLTNLKNGSAYSLNGPRSSMSSYTREPPQSKDGSMHSLGNGSARDLRESGRPSTTLDRDVTRKSIDAGAGAGSATASISSQQVNGTSLYNRSVNGKPMVNGDHHRLSVDEIASLDSAANAPGQYLSTSQPEESGHLSPDTDRLSPVQGGGPSLFVSPFTLGHRHTRFVKSPTTTYPSSPENDEWSSEQSRSIRGCVQHRSVISDHRQSTHIDELDKTAHED